MGYFPYSPRSRSVEPPRHELLETAPPARIYGLFGLFSQTVEEDGDGSLTVRFKAGGIDEMCWHLFTWGESVTVERPARLRRRLAGMCESLAAYHRQTTPRHV